MSEDKSFMSKLTKPFKLHSRSSSKSEETDPATTREVLDAAYLEGRKRGEKERFGGSTSGGAYGSAGGLAGLKGLDGPHKSVIEQAYHEGFTKGQHESKVTGSNALPYYKSTTSSDPTVLASSSVGKVVSQPPAVQRHAIERPLAGDFANQKQPTDRDVVHDTKHGHNAAVAAASAAYGGAAGAGVGAAGSGSSNHHDPEDAIRGQAINSSTVESTSKNSEGLVENSQPAYTDDQQVRQGTGIFFNPKDTQGGAYNNNDGRFPEATQATVNSRKDLRTEPTGYATEDGYHNPVAHPENTYLVGQGTTTEEKSGLKRGDFAGGVEGVGAAGTGGAVLASKHKPQSDYDAKVAQLDAEIDATQRDIDALHLGHKGSSDSASTDAVYDEPLASRKHANTTSANTTSQTGTSSHTSKKVEDKAYQQGVHNAAYNAGAEKAIAQQQQQQQRHEGATQSAYTSGVANQSYQSGVEHGAYDAGATTSRSQPSTTGAAVDKATGPHTNTVRTSDPNQPGVLDGAKGALGAAAALAAGAVGYGAHESSNTAGVNTHSTNSNAGVIGSGDKVYTDHRSLDPATTSGTHHDATDRSATHSESPGVMGGIAGAIGGAAAAIGLNPHGETTDHASAERTEQGRKSTGGVLSSLGWGSGDSNAVHSKDHDVTHASQAADSSTTNKDLSYEQTTPRGNAPDNSGGITSGIKNTAAAAAAATGAAAAATGLSSNSARSQSHSTRSPVGGSGAGSEKESLIATAVRNHPDVKEEPAHPSSGNIVQEKKPETSDSTGPADEDNGPKRDLEAEMVEHNRKHGIKNDDRSLIEIAEQNSEEVKRAAAHHGKSGVLEEEDESKNKTGDNVQPVPAEVFQNQNTFTRTGGKHGSPNDSTSLRGDSHSEHHSTSLCEKHYESTDRYHDLDATHKHHGATTGAAAGAATAPVAASSKNASHGAHNENTTHHGSSDGSNSLAAGAPSGSPLKSTGATAPAAGAAASDERYHAQHHGSNKNLPLTPQEKTGYSQNETKPLKDNSSGSKAAGLGGILGGIIGGKKQHETDANKDLSKQEHQELYRQGAQQGAYEMGEVKAAKDVSSKQASEATGAAVGGASGAGYSHHQSQQSQGYDYVPPVGEDKDIGDKFHKQHEAVKSKLEQDAEEGRLGNVQPEGVRSGSTTSSHSHGHSGVVAGAAAGGATGAAGAAALGSSGSHRGQHGAAPSNSESLTVEVVGVKDEAAASKIAHQASKELLDKGVDLSSGKLVINTETKEIYKAAEGSNSGSSQPRGAAAGIAGQQSSEYVPPVGQDKNIGNKYHQQHEAVKSKLEKDAEDGKLGNVGQPEGSGYTSTGKSDQAGILGGAGATGHSTGKSASEIVVTVRGTQDSAAANHIASETVEQLKGHPDLLRNVKELQIDSNTGNVFDERGNKIATAAIAGQSSLARSTSNSGSATTGQSSNEPYTHPTKGPAESTNLASSTTGATSGAPASNEPVQMPGSFIS
jgi:hypothetical protein